MGLSKVFPGLECHQIVIICPSNKRAPRLLVTGLVILASAEAEMVISSLQVKILRQEKCAWEK